MPVTETVAFTTDWVFAEDAAVRVHSNNVRRFAHLPIMGVAA
jgi:hypothetical protein